MRPKTSNVPPAPATPMYLVATPPVAPAIAPLAVSLEEAAVLLGVSRATMFRLIKDGTVKGTKLLRRRVFAITELQGVLDKSIA